MHHSKTSFFLSGVYLAIELLLVYVSVSARSYLIASVVTAFFFLEIYRSYRKTKYKKENLTREEKTHRDSLHLARSYYYNIWYNFADASEHVYMANKFQEGVKRIRRK